MAMANTIGTNFKYVIGNFLPSGTVMDPVLEKIWYPPLKFYGNLLRETGYMHLHSTKPDTVGESQVINPL